MYARYIYTSSRCFIHKRIVKTYIFYIITLWGIYLCKCLLWQLLILTAQLDPKVTCNDSVQPYVGFCYCLLHYCFIIAPGVHYAFILHDVPTVEVVHLGLTACLIFARGSTSPSSVKWWVEFAVDLCFSV